MTTRDGLEWHVRSTAGRDVFSMLVAGSEALEDDAPMRGWPGRITELIEEERDQERALLAEHVTEESQQGFEKYHGLRRRLDDILLHAPTSDHIRDWLIELVGELRHEEDE